VAFEELLLILDRRLRCTFGVYQQALAVDEIHSLELTIIR